MPLSFVSTLPHITVMLYPGVSVPIVFDTGSGVNLMSLSWLLWLQLVAPSAVMRVYDCEGDHYPFVPIHVRGVTTDASADPSSIPGSLTKVAVLRTRHIITMDGVPSPLLLTFSIGSDVSVNACLGIATIEALCLLFDPVKKTVYNDDIGLLLQCPSRRPVPRFPRARMPVCVPGACSSPHSPRPSSAQGSLCGRRGRPCFTGQGSWPPRRSPCSSW